jgi:hypothetical protein
MQGFQRHVTALHGGHLPGALSPCPIRGLTYGGERQVLLLSPQAPFLHQPVVPVSPGHVRPLHPYPPSRRRRR